MAGRRNSNTMNSIRVSKPEVEGVLKVSKWLYLPLLLEIDEMEDLLNTISSCQIYCTANVCKHEEQVISQKEFMRVYKNYISQLKEGSVPSIEDVRRTFYSTISEDAKDLYVISIDEQQSLVRACRPVIQLQAHHFSYSEQKKKVQSMSLGLNTISWGILFSFPQIYQDNEGNLYKTLQDPSFSNGVVFKNIQKWVRKSTIPTSFSFQGERINSSLRIGKNCLSWINQHKQMRDHDIQVRTNLL